MVGIAGIFEVQRQPAHDTDEHCHQMHIVTMVTSGTTINQSIDGQSRNNLVGQNNAFILPAGALHRCSWLQDIKFMFVGLDPHLFVRVGQELVKGDRIELIPHFAELQDPLIQGILLTQKQGVDLVVEVGGAGTLEKSLRSASIGGIISLIGVLGGAGDVNHTQILMKSIDVQGIYVGSREMFEAMNRAIALHQIKPIIDRVFPFNEAPEAYRYLKSGSHFGKVVIQF